MLVSRWRALRYAAAAQSQGLLMLTFFHGWRRKMGVATLVMACVSMAGWVRSFQSVDTFKLNAPRSIEEVVSVRGRIELRRLWGLHTATSTAFHFQSKKLRDHSMSRAFTHLPEVISETGLVFRLESVKSRSQPGLLIGGRAMQPLTGQLSFR
jgi:hypothetical protein